MRLEKASAKAIKYAIMNWHYSKKVPLVQLAYSVFNENGEFCGVICYSIGANNKIGTFCNLKPVETIELVRVALNGKQESTSKALSISLKLAKKDSPMTKMIVSYADTAQGHKGCIYQATNWFYIGDSVSSVPIINGQKIHKKTLSGKKNMPTTGHKYVKELPKHKYIYPLCKSMLPLCRQLAKPYPKKALEVHAVEHLTPSQEVGGSSPTPALQNREKTEDNAE